MPQQFFIFPRTLSVHIEKTIVLIILVKTQVLGCAKLNNNMHLLEIVFEVIGKITFWNNL